MTPRRAGDADDAEPDGRRRRGSQSREQIIRALFALLRRGVYAPSVAQVAHAAGVGERTVFRHFADIESLYREMAEEMEAAILPALLASYASADWREQLREQVERRIRAYEEILPVKTAASLQRFRSRFLMQDHRRHLRMEESALAAVLPDAVRADATRVSGLRLALSFQAWQALREDQGLSVEAARATVLRLIEPLAQAPSSRPGRRAPA